MDRVSVFGTGDVGSIPAGCTREEKAILLAFSDTCADRSHVSIVIETGEVGSRKFPSVDEEIIRDH